MRSWWNRVAEVLFEYEKQVAKGSTPEPAPVSVIRALRGLAGYLAVGKLPAPIKSAIKRGSARPGPTEKRDIGLAVAYCQACGPSGREHNGVVIRIDDPDPVERIHLWYGVSKRTVYDWLDLGDSVFLGVNDVNGEVLIKLTVDAAERYRAAGRSQGAVRQRAGKRKQIIAAR